ncbi:tmRNA-binding protein SmpB [Indibacter alkaliphilus LW1]|jgi:SsrA-binding protein|uniref:SsrA-binding protein n=1 Tax=Indibacter alkaliphilus (strain CCUG 57479 / KCTC 22604 / LW1) TaxID=1189612 RepID=S2DNM8_INDAL|nr:SsrA-binding protein [Indibacter alkaliphilus]EPA00533.1 tmRNA-binding protein SmpB [Indibacter alkaliphilus LW1]
MGQEKKKFEKIINIKNKKASYEFEFIDTFKAGLVLKGTEIKSIREGKVSLTEAYCFFRKGELFIKQMHIAPYSMASSYNHEAVRERKLLLSKKELEKLESKFEEKGLSIIPVRIFINDKGLAKLEIALARGKKVHDKRQSIKEKDTKRELARMKF